MVDYIEIIGYCAGTCTTFSAVPQIQKILDTRSAKDISFLTYIFNSLGVSLWIMYGFYKGSIPLIIANIVSLIFFVTVIILKYRWERPRNPSY